MSDVGWPRLERNADGVPIWDQGPLGMSVVLAHGYAMGMPARWPDHWPEPPLSAEVAAELIAEWRSRAFGHEPAPAPLPEGLFQWDSSYRPPARGLVAQARAALDRWRRYASEHGAPQSQSDADEDR